MGDKLGNEGRIYYNTAANAVKGSSGNLIQTVRDVDMKLSASEVDKTSRKSGGWRGKRSGLREWGVSFDMIRDSADSAWIALRTAFLTGQPIGLSVLDGAYNAAGAEGLHGACFVTEFTNGEPLDDVMTSSVTIVGDGAPTWGGLN